MNRESSRSHSVFTCVIESRWEKDSTSNLRFARLNLVDLAGSERQKTSGAEGERLKEAANINKSLSTLGHVIMVLVDGANARTRHVPYRDSRLTFLLQDSLGGNSKTMIIANVSPSICSATETLNTLKFAQRAKLIQNNAVVNEDASGDIVALQHQIQLLKEELAILKRHNVSRSLTFGPEVIEELEMDQPKADNMLGHENKVMRVSSKQLKSLETSLTGALRREQMSETSIKQLEAEIQHLNRLVRQREEDNKCTKMMLKFREDKINRMESLLAGSIPADSYLVEENNILTEEIQMLRAKADRNPEVTRFALENIRLLEQLRRFQEFYEEGEREMLVAEVSELRYQLVVFLDENSKQDRMQKEAANDIIENNSLQLELEKSQEELEKCRNDLNSCLERNAKFCKEIADLNVLIENQKSAVHDNGVGIEVIKEPILVASSVGNQSLHTIQKTSETCLKNETGVNYIEDVMDLQLEVDILKIILKEERSSRGETEEKYLLITKQYKDLKEELEEAKSVIEALETQQLISINELEDLRNSNQQYAQILHEKELKIISMNNEISNKVSRDLPNSSEQEKLKKMQDSLERARRTNKWYKSDRKCHATNEEEMDEVRKQVEAETAEVIVCLQEELNSLQQQVNDGGMKESAMKLELMLLEEKLKVMTECNETLMGKHEEKGRQLNILTNEIEEVLTAGHEALEDASSHLEDVTVYEQLQMITRSIFEKESRIKELSSCLEDARNRGNEMEDMLRALRGATLVMAEAHEHDCIEKDQVIRELSSQLNEKSQTIAKLNDGISKASVCATGAFVIVNRFSEVKDSCLVALAQKEAELNEMKKAHTGRGNGTIVLLKKELETAIGSLNGVKTEMARLRSEKEAVLLSEKRSRESIELLVPQVMTLQSGVDNFEEQIGVAMVSLDHKIQTVEGLLQESCKSCIQKRKVYEVELMDAKVNAAQQAAESSCVLAKFAEARYTIKEADVMINELVIANETMKLDIEALKNERDMHKKNYEVLGQRFEAETMGMKKEVEELEGLILQIQSSVDEDLMPIASDFVCMKSQLNDLSKLIQSWLEDIWSEIIAKDCAVSVLRVCHMGILLETVTGLNAENNLLNHGLRESNSLVSELREHNCKSRKELEMCRVVQGKLLADIKNSFDRVSRSTEETGLLSVKLASFEKKIVKLQLLEEAMVERSNYMGSELSALVKEMDKMGKEEEIISREEKWMVDLLAKEIELLIVSSKLKQMDSRRNDLEKENNMVLEKFKEKEAENFNLKSELERKDEVVEGLVFDLRLLQESLSNKQDEIEELEASFEALENEFNENVLELQVVEAQLKEKVAKISTLEADVLSESELVKSLFYEIQTLNEKVKDGLKAKELTEVELAEAKKANERLEMELVQLETALREMKTLAECRTSDFNSVSCKRDALHSELLEVRKELDMAQALAEENEAIATEAKEMAETSKRYAEEKEEEVKLYEKSVEELECIVNVLESQVDMVKGDAERQRLQREELELEFHAFKQQIHAKSNDLDMKSLLNEKEKCLQEVLQRVQILEKEIASKDTEIGQHKAHITELNLHAEAQAREFKQTFKALGAMADQVKPDASAPHISNSPSKKLERAGSRTRGSGSPFKCIGIGLAQQMKSEKDEELSAAKHRIEELEALAASRQKEIFTLNAKLAMSGSMTHDVLRDLLGIKLDMTTYSLLVDGHQIEETTKKCQIHNAEGQLKEEEVTKLKQQLNELIMERKGWLEEIERKQAEMVAAQVLLEQLRQRDRLLTTENEIFKTEISNHKMKAVELEAEVRKLSGQQNLQQRIHHHTKIKEENNALKTQNDELSRKLRKTDVILCRVKEELASLRAASGMNSNHVENELKLNTKLKEKEEERDQLAQKLAALYTSILKAAGVTRPTSNVSISAAEEALEQLQSHVDTLERELQDLQYKNRISNERLRLFELMPQMGEENRQTNSRASSRSPFLSTLDR